MLANTRKYELLLEFKRLSDSYIDLSLWLDTLSEEEVDFLKRMVHQEQCKPL